MAPKASPIPLHSHTQMLLTPLLSPPNLKSANRTPISPQPQPPSAAPAPTENDSQSQSQSTRPIPASSISPTQGPKGTPTQQKTAKPDGADKPGEGTGSLKEAAMKNVTMLGDPVSLKAETSEHSPRPEEDGARERLRSKI